MKNGFLMCLWLPIELKGGVFRRMRMKGSKTGTFFGSNSKLSQAIQSITISSAKKEFKKP